MSVYPSSPTNSLEQCSLQIELWKFAYWVQGNAIDSTADLGGLRHLVELDLRYNLLASLSDVSRLSGTHGPILLALQPWRLHF